MSTYKSIPLEQFSSTLGTMTELSSVALGGHVLSCSDEWFAPASDLLKVAPAQSMKGQFGPAGALFDGWETRRHNPTYDWVILRLGPAAGGTVLGFDIDTANFNGNEAPEIEVLGLTLTPEEERNVGAKLEEADRRWAPLLPRLECQPSARHLYSIAPTSLPITHIKLLMIPDGGIARFRVYGTVPAPPLGLGVSENSSLSLKGSTDPKLNTLDLAHVMNGGRVVFTSDQHFGVGANVILPGRGKDMGDGWETKRSRAPGHKDWLVIKLGEAGFLNYVEIDTIHFLGNFPESCDLYATSAPSEQIPSDSAEWTLILPRSKLGPGKQHFFALENVSDKSFSHVKLAMHPDGGIKRLRVVGRRAAPLQGYTGALPDVVIPGSADKALPAQPAQAASAFSAVAGAASAAGAAISALLPSQNGTSAQSSAAEGSTHQAALITPQNFAPYGHLIAGPSASQLSNVQSKTVNQGTAQKYLNVSPVEHSFPEDAAASLNTHVYRCKPVSKQDLPFKVRVLERHRYSTQAFIPMTSSRYEGHDGYLVIVALNGADDKPDLSTLAGFQVPTTQGITYGAGVWHHPMIALGSTPTDFACIVAESAKRPDLDCDELTWDREVAVVAI